MFGHISPEHGCQHYVGYADVVRNRLAEHLAGRGARLTQVAIERNIFFASAQRAILNQPNRMINSTLTRAYIATGLQAVAGEIQQRSRP